MIPYWRLTPHPESIGYFPTELRRDRPPLLCDICGLVIEHPTSRSQRRHQTGPCAREAATRAAKRGNELAKRKRAEKRGKA